MVTPMATSLDYLLEEWMAMQRVLMTESGSVQLKERSLVLMTEMPKESSLGCL